MKKVLKLLIVMSVIYILLQIGFKLIEKGHEIEYKVTTDDNQFAIHETYTKNVKNEADNYYLKITIADTVFDYQTFKDFHMRSKIITNIKYFKDNNYECMLPIFVNDELLSDIICKKNDIYYHYYDIKNTDTELDHFASTLESIGYNYLNFEDTTELLNNKGSLTVYNNLLNHHYLGLENYKGIYTVNTNNNENIYNSAIFTNDVYTKYLSAYVGKYYLVADYNKETKFNEFTKINLTNNVKSKISYDYDINMDSYIQGVVGNSAYIYDRSTAKQYEVDVKLDTIIEVGNREVGYKKFINNEFITVPNNADEYKFTAYSTDNSWNGNYYAKVDKTGISKSGYYYIYEQVGSNYKVYKSNIQNGLTKIYLFTTDNIDSVTYFNDYIYYRNNGTIKRYSEINGVRTILKDTELEFNPSLKFGVYQK